MRCQAFAAGRGSRRGGGAGPARPAGAEARPDASWSATDRSSRAAVLAAEPDRIGRGFALGPAGADRLERSAAQGGFLQPASLFGQTARIALPPGVSPIPSGRRAPAAAPFPSAGLAIRDRNDAAPGARRLIDRLEYFLGFIGLAALLAGGLGVSGAVSAYLEPRKPSIAVLKALGADGALIRNTLSDPDRPCCARRRRRPGRRRGRALLGLLVPARLPVPALFAVYPGPLIRAGLFGAAGRRRLFARAAGPRPLDPAGRAVPPRPRRARPARGRKLSAPFAVAGLAGLAVRHRADTARGGGIMIAGVAAAFVALWVARTARRLARRAAARPAARARAHRPGQPRRPRSAARTASPAIGLGVALLAAVVLIQSSLLAEVKDVAPEHRPGPGLHRDRPETRQGLRRRPRPAPSGR